MGSLVSESEIIDEKYARAYHLIQSGRLGEARPLIDDLKKLASGEPMIWIFSGFVSATLSQKSDAESSLKKAETLAKDQPLVWFNIGIVYRRLDNSGQAKSMFSKAAKIDNTFKDKGKLAMKEEFRKL